MIDKEKIRIFLINIKKEAEKKSRPLQYDEVISIVKNLNLESDLVNQSIPILERGYYVNSACIRELKNRNEENSFNSVPKVVNKNRETNFEKETFSKSEFMKENRHLIIEVRNYFSKNEKTLVSATNWNNFAKRRDIKIPLKDQEGIIKIFVDLGLFSKSVKPFIYDDSINSSKLSLTDLFKKYKKVIVSLEKYINDKDIEYIPKNILETLLKKVNLEISEEDYDDFIELIHNRNIINKFEDDFDLAPELNDIMTFIIDNIITVKSNSGIIDKEDILLNTLNYYEEIESYEHDFYSFLNMVKKKTMNYMVVSEKQVSMIDSIMDISRFLGIKKFTDKEAIELLKKYSFFGPDHEYKTASMRRLLNSHSIETFGNEKSYSNSTYRYFWKPSASTYELINHKEFNLKISKMNNIDSKMYAQKTIALLRKT